MITRSVQASSFFAFWTCATWTDQAILKDRLTAIGFGDLAPRPMSPSAALRSALDAIYANKTRLIRPLKDVAGFAVIEEDRGQEENTYNQSFTARLDLEHNAIRFKPFDQERSEKIAEAFNKHRGWVSGSEVGTALVKAVKQMRGVTVRESGCLYAIPGSYLEEWKKVALAVEESAAVGGSQVYAASLHIDGDALRVVRDAIQREVVQASQAMLDEISTGELGQRALDARVVTLLDMESKINEYEALLGESLVGLHASIDRVGTALGIGSFLANNEREAVQV